MRSAVACVLCAITLAASGAWAEEPAREPSQATTLDDLLRQVRRGWNAERAENQRREAEFREARDQQKRLLEQALARLRAEEDRSEQLEAAFNQNEQELAELGETLRERLGTLGELFGVVRQVAGDTRGHIEASLVSAQYPGRAPFLEELGRSKSLPSIESLEQLWYTLLQEMTEAGKVVRFPATVLSPDGAETQRDVIRAGVFNAVADGKYLVWLSDVQKLSELKRQPAARYRSSVADFESASSGMAVLAVDPSRGSLLRLIVDTPDARERVAQGGLVGYAIIVLGVVTGLLAVTRWVAVLLAGRKVAAQQKSDRPDPGNPLGRVLAVYDENRSLDPETLGLKLDQAILHESGRLERFLWAIRVASVVSPLMGLLGTVTGMIETFQAITLYGTGDPKLMAGGISEALVTTMLGLIVAIPLVLLHAAVQSSCRRISETLEEQSAGLVAARAEATDPNA
ncbi:MAG: MotA/TolQ/ExbB proton channel family protein [Proteobacteria bacterium]|nr:MotA/TolQ/ExbB proton channel family protein [Pseudomonadota bacterium]